MKSLEQIKESIEALQPAPAHESMDQVAVRVAHWVLTLIADEHESISMTASLYERAVAGDMPAAAEWEANENALARARALYLDLALARARALALALALALARARALDLDLDRALARALDLDRALARALDLDLFEDAIIKILGDRLQPMPDLHVRVADAVACGSLDMSTWHSCDTEHCRAGWANTIHPLGLELEKYFGPEQAGRLVYKVSTGIVPDFFASDAVALADIRRCALEQRNAKASV